MVVADVVLLLPPPQADTSSEAIIIHAKDAKVSWCGETYVIRFLRKVEGLPSELG
jgi:hypothetical protein